MTLAAKHGTGAAFTGAVKGKLAVFDIFIHGDLLQINSISFIFQSKRYQTLKL